MTKKKRTQGELLEEISYKLTVIIDQLGNILDYKPPFVDDTKEEKIEVENYDYVQDKDLSLIHI